MAANPTPSGPYELVGTVDPSAGGGVAAPKGSSFRRLSPAQMWLKTGTADTAWSMVLSSAPATLGGDDTQDLSGGPNPITLAAPSAGATGIRLINYATHVSQIAGIDSTGATDGRLLFIWADGPNNTLLLMSENGSASVNNRVYMFVASTSLTSAGGALVRYSTNKNRWVLIEPQ